MRKELLTEKAISGVILGHAIGDALGVPVEFRDRRSLQRDPVRDYRGFGSHCVPAGTWSDDTSMTLASLDSLSRGPDYGDMMERFCNWKEKAAYTATNVVFDMGITTNRALCAFRGGRDPLHCGCGGERDNGNGSLMRILPGAMYALSVYGRVDCREGIRLIHDLSALTHSHIRSCVGCGIYSVVLGALLENPTQQGLRQGLEAARLFYEGEPQWRQELETYHRIFRPDFEKLPEDRIRSSGYVVDTLEAALWCLMNTDSYGEAVLKAVNLGEDTDTVAAVTGGLAGALYGPEGIPENWKKGLLAGDTLRQLCTQFAESLS